MRQPGDLVEKDPQSDEPYGFDWSPWLAELGTAIAIGSSSWAVTGPDALLTTHDPSLTAGNLKTIVYLAGGTPGMIYVVTNHIATNSAPTVADDRSFQVYITQR